MANVKVVNNQVHKNIRIKDNPSLIQSKNNHFVPIIIQEFINVSKEFPIVFVKDAQTGVFNSVALLGLEPQENLFFDDKIWQATYIPQLLGFYPFLIQQEQDGEQAVLCIDEDSILINDVSGEKLFDDAGKQMDWLTIKAKSIVMHIENRSLTQKFIKLLLDKELLSMQTLSIKLEDKSEYDLNGLYIINEEQFNNLSDSDFLELRVAGVLPAIYAVLMSMPCINNLINRKNISGTMS